MHTIYHVKNLDCADCALRIENHLRTIRGIKSASLNFAALTLAVESDTATPVREEVRRIEPEVDIVPLSQRHTLGETDEDSFNARREVVILGGALVLFVIQLLVGERLHGTAWQWVEYLIAISAYFLAGINVIRGAWRTVRRGALFDENVLMTIATAGALAIHALSEAVGVMIFYKIGELLQNLAVSRSRRSITSLLAVRPSQARVQIDGRLVNKSPEEVVVGEQVVVRPGERIPVDGVVVQGDARLDTSPLTGESRPRHVKKDDQALAGSVCIDGMLVIRVIRPFSQSSIARVLELVENAVTRKAKTERFVSRIARFYTPAVVIAAVGIAFGPPMIFADEQLRTWIYRALVLLVISCPCALVISIPLGFFAGIGGASRRGILVKGANFLEVLANVKTVVFDKTGTLTSGTFRVLTVKPAANYSESGILSFAAIAESHSNHPIAHSIRNELRRRGVTEGSPAQEHTEMQGMGVIAGLDGKRISVGNDAFMQHQKIAMGESVFTAGTVVHVAVDSQYAGSIIIGDSIKPEAVPALEALRKQGVANIFMLSGDTESSSETVASALKLDGFGAHLLPEDKVMEFERMHATYGTEGAVAFVGDGINDAPVLARADVGIAMGELGSDAAIESADVVLAGDSLGRIAAAISLGKLTRAIVWQNIIMALAIKAVFIGLGVAGLASMWEAVFADMGTALLAVFNSTRALRVKRT